MRSILVALAFLRAWLDGAEAQRREEARLASVRKAIASEKRLEEVEEVSFLDRVAANGNAVAPPEPPVGGGALALLEAVMAPEPRGASLIDLRLN